MPKSQEREADWLSLSQHPTLVQPAVVTGAERWGTNRICGTLPCGGGRGQVSEKRDGRLEEHKGCSPHLPAQVDPLADQF